VTGTAMMTPPRLIGSRLTAAIVDGRGSGVPAVLSASK
jgi:hypothetical protein